MIDYSSLEDEDIERLLTYYVGQFEEFLNGFKVDKPRQEVRAQAFQQFWTLKAPTGFKTDADRRLFRLELRRRVADA